MPSGHSHRPCIACLDWALSDSALLVPALVDQWSPAAPSSPALTELQDSQDPAQTLALSPALTHPCLLAVITTVSNTSLLSAWLSFQTYSSAHLHPAVWLEKQHNPRFICCLSSHPCTDRLNRHKDKRYLGGSYWTQVLPYLLWHMPSSSLDTTNWWWAPGSWRAHRTKDWEACQSFQ